MTLNTEVLSLNKVLLTPHSYQNFLQLLTFRNILLEHLLLGELFLVYLLKSFRCTFLHTLLKRKHVHYVTSNFIYISFDISQAILRNVYI